MGINQNKINDRVGYIFDIKRFAIHDGPGIRTTVFFKGCPLRCWWCHNPESHKVLPEKFEGCNSRRGYNRQLSEDKNEVGKEVSVKYLMDEIEKDRVFYEESGGGVTLSGGEPLMQPRFIRAVLSECKYRDINTVVDTSGYASWNTFESVLDCVDLFLFDIKSMDSILHKKYTGQSNDLIIQNLLNLDKYGKKYYLRLPIIPGVTDSAENISEVMILISSLNNIEGINLLPYHNTGNGKYDRYQRQNYLSEMDSPKEEYLEKIRRKFQRVHSNVSIGG